MATKKREVKRTSTKRAAPRAAPKRSFRGRAKSIAKEVSWGEALLMAAAGYVTGPALQDSGIANYIAEEASSRSAAAGNFFYHQGSGIPGEQLAKLIGTVIGGKGVYDVAKGKKKTGLNVEIPYGIGAILDPKSEYKTHANAQGARW